MYDRLDVLLIVLITVLTTLILSSMTRLATKK